jgi:hypothetical protein
MKMTDNELRALHVQACAAILKQDRTVTPADEAFWPLYIQAMLEARRASVTPFGHAYVYPSVNGPVLLYNTGAAEINGSKPTEHCALFVDPPLAMDLTRAEREVILERRRQVDEKGFSAAHDDESDAGDLAAAGAAYAQNAASQLHPYSMQPSDGIPLIWPACWGVEYWKPKTAAEDLKRAAALIIAELEKLRRHEDGSRPRFVGIDLADGPDVTVFPSGDDHA